MICWSAVGLVGSPPLNPSLQLQEILGSAGRVVWEGGSGLRFLSYPCCTTVTGEQG